MSYNKRTNFFIILISLGIISFLGILSFTSIQKEIKETEKIDAFFADFEDLNQYAIKDTLKPKIVTYSQLKNFNENDNYIHNRKDVSKSVTTYSKTNKELPVQKHYDVSSRISTYSEQDKPKKRYDVSKLVSVYKEPKNVKKEVIKNSVVKKERQTIAKKSPKVIKRRVTLSKPKKSVRKIVVKKPKIKKVIAKKTTVKKIIFPKKEAEKIVKRKVVKKQKPVQKTIKPSSNFTKENTPTLHYRNKVLNTATNINFVQSAPVYPSCNKNLSEDDKKSCLLTNVSKFVLDNFNSNIGKKAGLKKGFYEIRVLFVIDKNGFSKTFKILGKYDTIIKNEIRKIINNLPKMIPGKSNGKNVSVKYSVKVLFEVK